MLVGVRGRLAQRVGFRQHVVVGIVSESRHAAFRRPCG